MNRGRALAAIAMLAPAPSLGIAAALMWWPGPVGQALFTACKVWLLAFPAFWFFVVERGRLRWTPPQSAHVPLGVGSGLLCGLSVVLAYLVIAAPRLDPAALRTTTVEIGIGSPAAYIAGALYWIVVNSAIEEYVFRWFLFRQAERLVPPPLAILISSSIFTAHHVIALSRYLSPPLTALAAAGIFFGGAMWCWIYLRLQSLWPCWFSHAIIDAAVFAVGYVVVFGS